jgi:hypothetical protein
MLQLQKLICQHSLHFFVAQIWSHTRLPGSTSTRKLAGWHFGCHSLSGGPSISEFQLSKLASIKKISNYHTLCKTNHSGLWRLSSIWGHLPTDESNPRVFNLTKFGRWMSLTYSHLGNKLIHISIDTHSGFIFASLAKFIPNYLSLSPNFAVKRVPLQFKTDNGPAYISQTIAELCSLWQMCHLTGIIYSPQGLL